MDTAQKLLTVNEYLAITAELDDDMKWELVDGVMTPKASRVVVDANGLVAMAPGRRAHGRTKLLAGIAFERAVREAGGACDVTVDELAVVTTDRMSFIPDILVDCGTITPDARTAERPTIIVEVLSPSTRAKDITKKLIGYFSLDSISHYLIVDPVARDVQHHRRTATGIAMETHTGGTLRLDPPGLSVDLAAFFE